MSGLPAIAESGAGAAGGRVFFSNTGRSLIEEDRIELTSVGVDIGSSTSHLLFSTIVLERLDSRYVVAERRVLHRSDIELTPYSGPDEIDAAALGGFIQSTYRAAGLTPGDIDTGALILTGIAVRRHNARAIGDLFAARAGRFVALSAGDGLEALMAAHGSGAVALSIREGRRVTNIDIGGGTTKIAVCDGGEVVGLTAVESGARLIVLGADDRIAGIEPFGRRYLDELGLGLGIGDTADADTRRRLASRMAERILQAAGIADPDDGLEPFLRLPLPAAAGGVGLLTLSGGVSEFFYGRQTGDFRDLGPELAAALRAGIAAGGPEVAPARQGIRATVVGASQYTVQVSGSTIYFDPPDVLPVRNVPVIAPRLDLAGEELDATAVAAAVSDALARLDLHGGERAVAVAVPWRGSATFGRLRGLSRGLLSGLAPVLANGHPLVLVADGDIGGLLGMHCRQEEGLGNPVVSIDGIELREFDFIDIGAVLRATGAVPVVIKSLLFPAGQE